MEWNLQRAFLRAPAEIPHIKRLIIVDRYYLLFFVDRLNRRIGNLLRQPAMRHQRPAAVIDGQRVLLKLRITALGQDGARITHLLELFDDWRFEGNDFVAVVERLIQPAARSADSFIEYRVDRAFG